MSATLGDTGLAWPRGSDASEGQTDLWELALVQAPLITLEAIAVELYLKALHVDSTGSAPFGHDTGQLFNDLPKPVREGIQHAYEIVLLSGPGKEMGLPDEVGDLFRELSHAVTDFRYHYDRTPRVITRVEQGWNSGMALIAVRTYCLGLVATTDRRKTPYEKLVGIWRRPHFPAEKPPWHRWLWAWLAE